MTEDVKNTLIKTLKGGLEEVIDLLQPISDGLMNTMNTLRTEETEDVFRNLSNWLKALDSVYRFAFEMKRGLEQLSSMGIKVETNRLDFLLESKNILEDMLGAFEANDWVTVCDLIEYEIVPMLSKSKDALESIKDELVELIEKK